MHNRFLLPTLAILTGTLLSNCSHSNSDSTTTTKDSTVAVTTSAKRNAGTRVDSLNGIPGHHFGEPLSAFSGLLPGESNIEGMKLYYYSSMEATQRKGWFGKHRQQMLTNYYFVDGKFAYFMATAYGDNRNLLNAEVTYLFGLGDPFQLTGTIWQGKQARAIYTQPISTHGPAAQLEVASEPLGALVKQRTAERLQTDNIE
jgi:hypothetical protein